MRPDERELDEEIRGHLAINIKERIERGEDPESARRAALVEFGYLPAVREKMRRVWYSRWYDAAEGLLRDVRFAWRALGRAAGARMRSSRRSRRRSESSPRIRRSSVRTRSKISAPKCCRRGG